MMKDLRGQKFNKWLVIGLPFRNKNHTFYQCKCDCGTMKDVELSTLKRGTSSGCAKCRNNHHTHGKSSSKIYWIWHGMNERCLNKKQPSYKNYGGRGITVCDEWQKFEPFYEWAMANGYAENLTIDRIDVNGNYEPQNCRWATIQEQAENKRTSVKYTFNGETKTQAEWARTLGIARNTLGERVKKYGVEKALTTKKGKHLC